MSQSQEPSAYLSFSRLNTYNGCGKKYQLSYLVGAPKQPQGAFIAGSAIHQAIAESEGLFFHHSEEANELIAESFLAAFRAGLEEVDGPENVRWAGRKSKEYPQGEDARWWEFMGPVMLKRYITQRRKDEEAGVHLMEGGVEREVMARLPSGLSVKGYVDSLLLTDADGQRMIRDHKTGRPGADKLQLATYAWALEQLTGATFDYGQFLYLRPGDDSKRLETVDLRSLKPLIPGMYEELALGIQHELFPMKPSMFCSSCMVRESCPYGQTILGVP